MSNAPSDSPADEPKDGTSDTPVAAYRLLTPASAESLPDIRRLVVEAAERAGFSPEAVLQIEMAVDEACTNVIEHGYKADPLKHEVEIVASQFSNRMEIVISDYSTVDFPVNSTPNVTPEEYLGSERRRGLGLYIINNFVDRVEHRFVGGQGNELRLVKFCA